MPLIELLRPEQRAWLRRLRRRISNRELMRRTRADINRKLLCPGVDLPIEAGTCGRLIWPESTRCIYCHNRRTWLLKYALNKAEVVITVEMASRKGIAAPNGSRTTTSAPRPRASPSPTYGIYDPRANAGTVFVGQTADTPAFAVDCIEKWWRTEGRKHYPEAKALQILADGGGSNSSTARAWKYNLQHRLCNRHGLRVTVAHYPPATSKWNPIEHRLFCEVSKNWAGRPLDSYETILKYLRTTRTATGLRVRAHLVRKTYKTGIKVTDAQMQELRITPNSSQPKWNYTIEPM